MSMQMEKPTGKPVFREDAVEQGDAVVPAVDPRGLDIAFASASRMRAFRDSTNNSKGGYGMDYPSPLTACTKRTKYDERDGEDILESSLKPRRTSTTTPKYDLTGKTTSEVFAIYREILSRPSADDDTTVPENEWQDEEVDHGTQEEERIVHVPLDSSMERTDSNDSSEVQVLGTRASPPQVQVPDVQVLGTLEGSAVSRRGVCELTYVVRGNSQQVLTAMALGLQARNTDVMYPGPMFDFELDENLKTFPHKGTVLPKLNHLQEEAVRRAVLFKLRPIRKAARRNELIIFLKENPIRDPIDIKFVSDEINKTYKAIKLHLEEATAVERSAMNNRNWITSNWLRLYCCACDDKVRPFLLNKDNTMNRLEVDGRNNEERPPTWHEAIVEMYNSTKVYVTLALPELHDEFAEPRTLRFVDLPGGAVTVQDVKSRLADARAKLITMISNWEQSGNGFGMRDQDDPKYGHFSNGYGDSRSDFVKESLGQKAHHLYLWHLSDIMGVLKNVLNVLSKDVVADSERCPSGLALTQKKRSRPDEEGTDLADRKELKIFRDDITGTLKDIGGGMNRFNAIQAEANMENGINTLRSFITDQEDRVERYKTKIMGLDYEKDSDEISDFQRLVERHEIRLHDLEAQMAEKMHSLNKINGYQTFRSG
jgi:hypothetical protein